MTFLVNMLILTLVGFGVGDRLRRFGDALLERRPPLAELLLDLRPPLGEGLLDLLPPLPLELERLRLRLEFERLLDLDLDLDRDLDLDLDLSASKISELILNKYEHLNFIANHSLMLETPPYIPRTVIRLGSAFSW